MTILIKNIQLIDGTGRTPVKADVLVKNDRISAVGIFPNYRADETIDGMGAYLAPGFIDVSADSDRYLSLFDNPGQDSFLLQGVTGIIGGHCGVSLAPLIYGSLETLKEWSDANKVNVNWRTVAEFLNALKKKKLGINFGTLVGHATVREALIGKSEFGRPKRKELSKNELKIFVSILDKAMKEGALGISFGLDCSGGREIPYPELKTLASFIAEKKGVCATGLRDGKENAADSMKEILKLAKDSGSNILISRSNGEGIELAEKSPLRGKIRFGANPFSERTMLLESFLPHWARKEKKDSLLKDLKMPAIRQKLIKEFPPLNGKSIAIISAPGKDYLVGQTLKRFSKNANSTLGQGLISLMELTEFRAVISYNPGNEEKNIEFLKNDMAVPASNSASFKEEKSFLKKSFNSESSRRTFSRFLELAEKENIMPLEKAICKITLAPAQLMNIEGRGAVREGYFADLVIFKDAKIKEVIVNGKRAVIDGKIENSSAGKILKRRL
jgi:N-acyl-D-amino-acid deacylase